MLFREINAEYANINETHLKIGRPSGNISVDAYGKDWDDVNENVGYEVCFPSSRSRL